MKTLTIIQILIVNLLLLNSIFSQNNWTLLPIPDSLQPFFLNAEIPGYLYISSGYGAIFRSEDNGMTWNNISDSILMAGPIGRINDSSLIVNGSAKLFRSDNYGNNWYPIVEPDVLMINFIRVDAEENIYIGYWGGVVRSMDGGYSWDTLLTSDNNHCFGDIEFGDPGQIFIASHRYMGPPWGGFYRSLDNGLTFEHIGLDNRHVLTIEITSDNTLYASAFYGLYKSDDLGVNWDLVSDTIHGYPLIITPGDSIYSGRHMNYGLPIYFSGDLGVTWSNFSSGIDNSSAHMFSLSPDGHLYLVCGSGSNAEVYSTYYPPVSVSFIHYTNSKINIYPNPCHESIGILLSSPSNNLEYTVQIFDLSGKLHFSKRIDKESKFRININNLTAGTYLVVFRNRENTTVHKIVKI